jgi:hypothetical protein
VAVAWHVLQMNAATAVNHEWTFLRGLSGYPAARKYRSLNIKPEE